MTPQARQSLRRRGLLVGVWPGRLAQAGQGLIRFINRFHRVAGFEWVIRDYFAGRYKRAGAILAMRFAHRLADRQPSFPRLMSFERTLGLAPGGHLIRTVAIARNGVRYQFNPWPRLYPFALRGQFLRDMALLASPERTRWVFDGSRLGMPKGAVVREARRILSGGRFPQGRRPDFRRWLEALERVVVVV